MSSVLHERVYPDYRGSKTEYGLYVKESHGCVALAVWPADQGFDSASTLKHYLMMGTEDVKDLIAALERGLASAEAANGKKRLGRE